MSKIVDFHSLKIGKKYKFGVNYDVDTQKDTVTPHYYIGKFAGKNGLTWKFENFTNQDTGKKTKTVEIKNLGSKGVQYAEKIGGKMKITRNKITRKNITRKNNSRKNIKA